MRLGLVLESGEEAGPLAGLVRQTIVVEESGLELIMLMPLEGGPGALATAAALAPATGAIRLAAVVPVGPHPVRIAEEAAVADNCTGGRLLVVLAGDDPGLLGETADVVLEASAARPFAHAGPRWTIPARRPENSDTERRLRVTPAPVQLELPIWLGGSGAPSVARERGLVHLSELGETADAAEAAWAATDERLGPAARRLRRPAVRAVDAAPDGTIDDDRLVNRLRAERDRWGLDVAILRLPPGLDDHARARAIDQIARRVRPRVQLDRLPDGLEDHWRTTLALSNERTANR